MAKCPYFEKEVQLNSAKKEKTLDKINGTTGISMET